MDEITYDPIKLTNKVERDEITHTSIKSNKKKRDSNDGGLLRQTPTNA